MAMVNAFKPTLKEFELYRFPKGYAGVDIGPMRKYFPDMVMLGLSVNSQEYFNYHHSANDVLENVNKRELELGSAAMASMIYLLDQKL